MTRKRTRITAWGGSQAGLFPRTGHRSQGCRLTPQVSLFPSLAGPSHQAHPRAESELPQGLLLQREEPENNQSEPSPTAKQHKKAKKRKSLGTPVLPVVASTVSAPSVTLGPEREWHFLSLPFCPQSAGPLTWPSLALQPLSCPGFL